MSPTPHGEISAQTWKFSPALSWLARPTTRPTPGGGVRCSHPETRDTFPNEQGTLSPDTGWQSARGGVRLPRHNTWWTWVSSSRHPYFMERVSKSQFSLGKKKVRMLLLKGHGVWHSGHVIPGPPPPHPASLAAPGAEKCREMPRFVSQSPGGHSTALRTEAQKPRKRRHF